LSDLEWSQFASFSRELLWNSTQYKSQQASKGIPSPLVLKRIRSEQTRFGPLRFGQTYVIFSGEVWGMSSAVILLMKAQLLSDGERLHSKPVPQQSAD
jgi:hypothetical protein